MKRKGIVALICALVLVTALCVTLAACSKDDIKGIYKPTGISYDGERLTWNKVELADYYTVSINGGEALRVNTNVYPYAAQTDEFDATISAVIGDKSHSESRHFTQLGLITDITVSEDGSLSWTPVSRATAYRVKLNGSVLPNDLSEAHYQAPVGSSRIQIRAIVTGDDSYFSKWSGETMLTKYSAPSNVDYDGSKITWQGSSSQYELKINGSTYTAVGNHYDYQSGDLDFTVEVKAVGDHEYTFDSDSAAEAFHFLQPVRELFVEDGILKWNPIDGAEGYAISINNIEQSTTLKEPYYDKLPEGQSVAIMIKPFNNSGKYFSRWSNSKNVYLLPAPIAKWNSGVPLDGEAGNNFFWDPVSGASGYEVFLQKDGEDKKQSFGASTFAFGYAYTNVGEYTIRVKAIADKGTDYYDSKYSEPIVVERLAAPDIVQVSSDPDNVAAGFTVSFAPVKNANEYSLYKDGKEISGKTSTSTNLTDDNVVASDVSVGQTFTYTVRSVGRVITANGRTSRVTLGCLTSDANNKSFQIEVLPMPTNLTMEGYIAKWNAVQGVNSFAIDHSGTSLIVTQNSHDMSTLPVGEVDLKVCSVGNGQKVLASNYTPSIHIKRLAAPTNLRIADEGNGVLKFDQISGADSYSVYYAGSEQPLEQNAQDNMFKYITTDGATIVVRANANRWGADGRYYMTSPASQSQQFIRLAAPTFPARPFENSVEFVWNASKSDGFSPTYQVKINDVVRPGGQLSDTRCDISELEGGKAYTFTVKAIGNGTKYINSEESVAQHIYKLATPALRREDGKYVWKGVAEAQSYVLTVDGKNVDIQQHTGTDDYSADLSGKFSSPGTYQVKLYAKGDGILTIDGFALEEDQKVAMCEEPTFKVEYTKTHVDKDGAIKVTITEQSSHVSQYFYEIGGAEPVTTADTTASRVVDKPGSYIVQVKALGGLFDGDVYYIDSEYAGGGVKEKIILLAPPSDDSFSIDGDGVIKWGGVNNASRYEYAISYDGGAFMNDQFVTGTMSAPIANFRKYKTITVRIRAVGTGTNIINSEMIEWTWTNPEPTE